MKPILRFTFCLALGALPLLAQAGPGQGPRMEKIAHALNLTEAQKTGIQAIRAKHQPEVVLRRDAVQHARIDLRTALQDPATPEPRLRALYEKASAARLELILARRSVRLETLSVLTPEQRAKAADLRDMARGRMRERMRHPRPDAGMAG
jgi:Spy/CpxP family protein refolding chaperone